MTAKDPKSWILTDRGSGPPVILLPGLALDERLFEPILGCLTDRFRVVVVRIAQAGSLPAAARRIEAVADACGFSRFALGGLSMGGYVCFEFARLAPERLRALCLMNTAAKGDSVLAAARRRSVVRLCERGRYDLVVRPFLNRILSPRHAANPEIAARVLAMTNDAGPETMSADTQAIAARGDYDAVPPIIRCPTMILCGYDDMLTPPKESERMAAAISGSELHILDDCGHLSPLEQPRAVGHILAHFLEGVHR
ncbi:alpha/beta hydrolase [bacterium]|nr:alpha/beta hydrolase [bacterium]